ncbi:MAG TPA: hypothetical protein VFT10_00805 [Solirubrobacterales bacterium]|nr:hypothetical protein [Solirubrobacterales bacterium]
MPAPGAVTLLQLSVTVPPAFAVAVEIVGALSLDTAARGGAFSIRGEEGDGAAGEHDQGYRHGQRTGNARRHEPPHP